MLERDVAKEIDGAWIPVRYVRERVRCAFCRGWIVKGSPGASKGTRGTKAWWNKIRRVYECMSCRTDGFRAEEARAQIDEGKCLNVMSRRKSIAT